MSYSDSLYKMKYLKYKSKYMSLKQLGGSLVTVTPVAPASFSRYRSGCDSKCPDDSKLLGDPTKLAAYNKFITTTNEIRAKNTYTPEERASFDDAMKGIESAFGTTRNDNLIPHMSQSQLDNYVDAKQLQSCFSNTNPNYNKEFCSK